MTMFLPSHLAVIRAKLGRTAEVGAGIALYAGFTVFMGFVMAVVTPFALVDIAVEKAKASVEKIGGVL